MSKIGDPASKYGYHRDLDADIQDKRQKSDGLESEFELAVLELMKQRVEYIDGSVMSIENKWGCLIEAVKKVKEQYSI